MSPVRTVTDETFDEEVLQSEIPVLVDFYAQWCAPCRMLAPVLDKVGEDFLTRAAIFKMDVDTNQEIPRHYNVRSLPTLLFFKGGKVVDMQVGGATRPQIARKLEDLT